MEDQTKTIVVLLLIFALSILIPWLAIWAWNVLFGSLHTIEFTLSTWAATIILYSFFNGKVSYDRK